MVDIKKLIRENVIRLTPYSCARDEFQGQRGIFMDANENPYGNLNRYPDPYQKDLKKAISKFRDVVPEKIFLGNGSDEIIDLCFRVFCNPGIDKALTFPPTYGMYEVSASVNDVKVVNIPLTVDFQIDLVKAQPILTDKDLKLIFICSPNNPTGNSINFSDVELILENFNGIVVIDEAYIDFSDKHSFLRLIDNHNNLIIMQTFSKSMGLAAARVGIAFTNPEIVRLFNKIKPPYNISTINQKAALRKFNKLNEFSAQVIRIKKERERLSSELLKLRMTEKVYPSDANFILVRVNDANSLYEELIRRNIIVRNRTSVIYNCLRITVGKKSENDKLINALYELQQ